MDEQKKIKILNVLDALLSGDNEPDKFSEEYLEVSETMEVRGKRTFGYDEPIIYKRVI